MKSTFQKLFLLIAFVILITAACIFILTAHKETVAGIASTSMNENDLTLIIDAGHGGADGGAVSLSGAKESEINLDIALKLDQIAGFFGIPAVMTRISETLDYSSSADTIRQKKVEDQNNRLKLINQTDHAVLISIHQNKFPDGTPFGAQVLYAPTIGSKEFGEYMQTALIDALNPNSRRTVAQVPKSILLMNHIKCPAIIVECGFLSNVQEAQLLVTDTYRLKVAAVIAAGYLANRNTLINASSGGMNEG